MGDALRTAFERLDTLLRYVASGFVAVSVFLLLHPGKPAFWHAALGDAWWPWLLAPALLGVIIYSIHRCVLNHLFSLVVAWLLQCECPFGALPARYKDMRSSAIRFDMDIQRWRRRNCTCPVVKGIQREMDKWGAMVNLLYCSSYPFLALPWMKGVDPTDRIWVVVSGGVLLFFGIYAHLRISSFELRITDLYPDATWTG